MLAIIKDSVQANKQQQALAVNANPWTRRLGIVAPLFVFVIVVDAEYSDLTYIDGTYGHLRIAEFFPARLGYLKR
jgi:hypothetical protein